MAGAHPGGAGQILVIKLVVERAIVQVVWGSGVATITGPHSFGANRRNTCGNRPLNASASLWTLVWRLVLAPAGQLAETAENESAPSAPQQSRRRPRIAISASGSRSAKTRGAPSSPGAPRSRDGRLPSAASTRSAWAIFAGALLARRWASPTAGSSSRDSIARIGSLCRLLEVRDAVVIAIRIPRHVIIIHIMRMGLVH